MLTGVSAPYGSAAPQARPSLSIFGGGGGGGKGDPRKGVFMEVGGVPDFYYETEPGKYALVPEETRRGNPTLFGPQRLDYLRARLDKQRDREGTDRLNQNARSRWEREFQAGRQDADRNYSNLSTQLAQQGRQIANSLAIGQAQVGVANRNADNDSRRIESQHATTLAALDAQNFATRERTRVELAGIMQQGTNLEKTLAARALEARDENETRRFQIDRNDLLMRDKMQLESSQFDRQLAQDERASRRAKVISSLSLVAQSLARL